MKTLYHSIALILIFISTVFITGCEKKGGDDSTKINDENFYKLTANALIKCYVDIYNQNLAGTSTGEQNLVVDGPMGGKVNITGTSAYSAEHKITTTDLLFDMNNVKYAYDNNGWLVEITITGVSTYKGSFSSSYTSTNHQSDNIYINGSVKYKDAVRTIDQSGKVSISRSDKISANIFGYLVSW